MAADFFRINRGLEIFSDTDFQTSLIQILTDTVGPDTQADAIAAPVGSLWVINAGNATTTKIYQRFQDVNDDLTDWRDISDDSSWREPAQVCDSSFFLPVGTPASTIVVDGEVVADGGRVLFLALAGYDTFDVTPATIGTFASAIGAATYDFDANIDGVGNQALSIVLTGGETYNAIAALMSAVVVGGSAQYDDTLSAFAVISDNLTDTGSTVVLAAGTAGSGGGDLFAALAAADTKTFTAGTAVPGPGSNVYVYDQPSGTFFTDPANGATSGDAVYVQTGTCADALYFYNGTIWISTVGGTAAEEGFIRDFIGKDGTGPETPDYSTPTESQSGDEPSDRDPFTDATGKGTAAASMGYVAYDNDNLELAIAKLNNEMFQNNRHLYATAVQVLADIMPAYVNCAKWVVYVADAGRFRAYDVFAVNDGATGVDFTTSNSLSLGSGAITGLTIDVTAAAGAFTLTVTTSENVTIEIRRYATLGSAGVGGVTGFVGALHVQAV